LPERIRVARVITRLNIGGPAIQAITLTERLDPDRFEPMLIAGTEAPDEGDMLALRGAHVRAIRIPALGREIAPLADAATLGRLIALFRSFRPHVVHTHMAKAGALGRIAARLAGVPVVVHTFHGTVFSGYFGGPASRAVVATERALARVSTRIVAISPSQRDELLRLRIGDAQKIALVPLGFDLAPFTRAERGALRAELGIGDPSPLVGIVARLVPIKDVALFIDAAAEIAQQRADASFVIVGDGPQRDELRARAAARGIADRVRWLGWRADLPAIYADLDVVVLSSRSEGTPVSLIEALAAARPVVATAVGGVPDLLGGGLFGRLVVAGDAAGLARGVLDLLADATAAAYAAERGRDHVLATHDEDRLVARIDALYTELVTTRMRA